MSPISKATVRAIQTVLGGIIAAVLIVTFFVSLPKMESRYWPVTSPLEITRVEPATGGRSIVYATFEKKRQCDYVGIAWGERQADGSVDRVAIELLRQPGDVGSPNRPVGKQSSGPWVIGIAPDFIRQLSVVELYHRCHPFWTSVTPFYPKGT